MEDSESRQSYYRTVISEARAQAAGNLYTFTDDGSGVSYPVPYPVDEKQNRLEPQMVFKLIDKTWMPPFYCACIDVRAARRWVVGAPTPTLEAGWHIISCVRGPMGCGYFMVVEEVCQRGRELSIQNYKFAHEQAQIPANQPQSRLQAPSPPSSPKPVNFNEKNTLDKAIRERAWSLYGRSDTRISHNHSVMVYDPEQRFAGLDEDDSFSCATASSTPPKELKKYNSDTKRKRRADDHVEDAIDNIGSGAPSVAKRRRVSKPKGEFVKGSSKDHVIDLTKD